MSQRNSSAAYAAWGAQAPLFSALGDRTRLLMIRKLGSGARLSISDLSTGSRLTRQAVTKHLKVLEDVHLVQGTREGRKTLFSLTPEPIKEAKDYLELVSEQWGKALERLKAFVEKS